MLIQKPLTYIAINQSCHPDQDMHSLTDFSSIHLFAYKRWEASKTGCTSNPMANCCGLNWLGFRTSYHPQTAEGGLSSLLRGPN